MTAAPPAPAAPSPLRYADYRLFWLARFCVVLGTTAMVVVIGWQVYDVARSHYGMSPGQAAFQLGLLGLVQFVPFTLLTPVAGWLADRYERRSVARIAMMTDLVVAAALLAATAAEAKSLPLLFALAALHGAGRVFIGPAMQSITPNIVPAYVLPSAIAMNAIAWQSASVIGPAFGGLLYAWQPTAPYIMTVATLIAGFALISMVQPVRPPPMPGGVYPLRQMAQGLSYTWRDRFLLGAISLDLFAVLLGGATALLPVFARDILHVGPAGLGQLRAAPALGAAVVAAWLAFRPLRHNVGAKMLWAVAAFGVATALFGLTMPIGQSLWGSAALSPLSLGGFTTHRAMLWALAMLLVLGAADMLSVYVRGSLVQLNTPDAMRGRVSAVSGLAISTSNELGELQSGLAAWWLGAVGAVVAGGIGAVAVAALWAILFPQLRLARTFAPPPPTG